MSERVSPAARVPDWEARLVAYLAAAARRPFAYGRHDCVLHGANVVLALTGEDPAAGIRGRYRSRAGSLRILRELGHASIEAAIGSVLPDRAPAFARRGDLVLVDGMVGVCAGGDALFVGDVEGAPGWVRYPRPRWTTAWGIG